MNEMMTPITAMSALTAMFLVYALITDFIGSWRERELARSMQYLPTAKTGTCSVIKF